MPALVVGTIISYGVLVGDRSYTMSDLMAGRWHSTLAQDHYKTTSTMNIATITIKQWYTVLLEDKVLMSSAI